VGSTEHRIGVLLSGRGSNFVAIANAISAGQLPGVRISAVLSNKEDAPGLAIARERGLEAHAVPSARRTRAEHDEEMMARLREHQVDLVCLAGYMRIITPTFVQGFPNRILNIHPSLLPAFPGLDGPAQALAYGAKVAGCTVHFVDEAVDHGVVIVQRTIPVLDEDTEATLSARILAEEHRAYPEAIRMVLSGRYEIKGRRFALRTE
jgi:phosphoribosylglycinamide formyltransferase-1